MLECIRNSKSIPKSGLESTQKNIFESVKNKNLFFSTFFSIFLKGSFLFLMILQSLCIQNGFAVEALDEELFLASFKGELQTVESLIERGADVHVGTKRGVTPLHVSAEEGHTEVVKVLIKKGAKVDARTERGSTPLERASYGGHLDVVKVLVENGASLDFPPNVPTPLHTAALRGYEEMIHYFLDQKVDINVLGLYGSTPLHWASGGGNFEVVKLLVARGAKIDARSEDGTIPFHWSVLWTPILGELTESKKLNKFRIIRYFLEQGVDLLIETRQGKTARQLAEESNLEDIRDFLKTLEDKTKNKTKEKKQ